MVTGQYKVIMKEIHKRLGRKPRDPQELTKVLSEIKEKTYISLPTIYKIWEEYGFSSESRKHAVALLKIIRHNPNPKHVEDLIETALYKRVNCPLDRLKKAAVELWGLEHMDGISDPETIKKLENLLRLKVYLKLATEHSDRQLAGIKSRLFKPTPSRRKVEELLDEMRRLSKSQELLQLQEMLDEIEELKKKAKEVRGDWW